MNKKKGREDFWLILGLINFAAAVYPTSWYLQAGSTEEQILAVSVLCGVALLLTIVDTVSIAVAYLQ